MKKVFACLLAALSIGMSALPAYADSATQIILNGTRVDIPEGSGRVYVENGRTYVPIRFVSEALECAVNWDPEDRLIIIATKNMSDFYMLQSGSSYLLHQKMGATTTSERFTMDVPTYFNEAEGRNYIPVRFLAEAMGYTVDWDETDGTVILNKAE